VSPRKDFDQVCASVCERRGWTLSADRIDVKVEAGRKQVVNLGFFEHEGAEMVRLHSVIGSTKKILPDRLAFALQLNFGLPHGSFAVSGEFLVLVDTLRLADANDSELDACIGFLAETGDYYERSMFGSDSY
jgi:hypothetical protein